MERLGQVHARTMSIYYIKLPTCALRRPAVKWQTGEDSPHAHNLDVTPTNAEGKSGLMSQGDMHPTALGMRGCPEMVEDNHGS